MATEILLTATEVAEILKVHTSTVFRWARTGEMPKPLHIKRSTRWKKSDIDNFLSGNAPTPPTRIRPRAVA